MDHGKTQMAAVKAAVAKGDYDAALTLLRAGIRPSDPFVLQSRAAKYGTSIAPRIDHLRPLKIALLADSTVDHFVEVLRLWLVLAGIRPEFYIAPFGMMIQTVLDEEAELYAFKPDVVWLFSTYRNVTIPTDPGVGRDDVAIGVGQAVTEAANLWRLLLDRLNCLVLQNNADIPADDPFGNIAGAAAWGSRTALRRYNAELAGAAPTGVVVFDLDHQSALFGKSRWVDARYWHHSKHAFGFEAAGQVAHAGAQLLASSKGLAKKCLVLDLDNTLWGGVIGDDGIDGIKLGVKADGEAFTAFQAYAKSLKERGIILAVCSKNEDSNAKEPFLRHPDMRLTLDDIAVFRANWNNKVDNIRDIATTLNIGLDSLVFVDDNPAEREIVRQFLPMVEVPELPEDPAGYIEAVAVGRYFEAVAFSSEDRERARYYQENAQRAELQMSFKDAADYRASLLMVAEVGSVDSFHLPRMSQLINKSNQFHLTGTRYSEADVEGQANRDDTVLRFFKLRDRFGDNGLISVLVLQHQGSSLVIDTWVMSCRVLGRSMEEFIALEIIRIARERGCDDIVGRYVPSPKNKLVAELYPRLGFTKVSDDNGVTVWRRQAGDDRLPVSQIERAGPNP